MPSFCLTEGGRDQTNGGRHQIGTLAGIQIGIPGLRALEFAAGRRWSEGVARLPVASCWLTVIGVSGAQGDAFCCLTGGRRVELTLYSPGAGPRPRRGCGRRGLLRSGGASALADCDAGRRRGAAAMRGQGGCHAVRCAPAHEAAVTPPASDGTRPGSLASAHGRLRPDFAGNLLWPKFT